MDKAFILQQIAYHRLIVKALEDRLQAQPMDPTEAIKEARAAVQSIEPTQVTFEAMSNAVKAYAVAHSKEKARQLLKKVTGFELIRDVPQYRFEEVYKEFTQ